jgi:hypothetical protein
MGLLGVARVNTAVGVSPETFLLLLLQLSDSSLVSLVFCTWSWWTVLSVWLTFLTLLLCLGYVAPMGVSLACAM